jgi:hypothetical protein
MAALCPQCQKPIQDDFGIINCSNCGAILNIGLDGEVELQADATNHEDKLGPANEVQPTQLWQRQEEARYEMASDEAPAAVEVESAEDSTSTGFVGADFTHNESAEVTHEAEHEESPIHNNLPQDVPSAPDEAFELGKELDLSEDSVFDDKTLPAASKQGLGTSTDMDDVADFGNSEISQAREGLFYFDINIRGVDTPEIRHALREALTDKRFLWNVEEVMKDISKGNLIIKQVNPVKSVILINRIKSLPIEIEWKQYAITQP